MTALDHLKRSEPRAQSPRGFATFDALRKVGTPRKLKHAARKEDSSAVILVLRQPRIGGFVCVFTGGMGKH